MIYICYHFTCGCRSVFGGIYFPLVNKFLLVCVSFVGVLCLKYELYHVILLVLVYFNMNKECLKMIWCLRESDREKVGFEHGSLRSQFRV